MLCCLCLFPLSGLNGAWAPVRSAEAAVRLAEHYHDINWDIFIRSVEVVPMADAAGEVTAPAAWICAVHLVINSYSYIPDDSWTGWKYHLVTASGQDILPLTETAMVTDVDVQPKPGAGPHQQTIYFALPTWPIPLGTLMINTQPTPIPNPLRLPVPYDKVRVISAEPPPRTPVDGDLQIVRPADGELVTPGEVIPFDIVWPEELGPPARIMILTPTRTFQDYEANGHYTLRIEPSAERQTYPIIALLVWGEDLDQSPTLSQSVSLRVVSPQERYHAQQIPPASSAAGL